MEASKGQGQGAPSTPRERSPIEAVAERLLAHFGGRVSETVICLQTPVPERVDLRSLRLPGALQAFVEQYEPRAAQVGLYSHQAEILKHLQGEIPNVVLTTATGSGKSLAFWAWTLEALRRDPDATAVACFPTQALLWGQTARLERISEPASLRRHGEQAYAGTLALGGVRVPWTVWHGVRESGAMGEHEATEEFARARLRIATVDKLHWSLLRDRHAAFLRSLAAVVLDEAHAWHGLAGASLRALLDRIWFSLDLHGLPLPALFIASATLAEPTEFVSSLTGYRADSFLAIDDKGSSTLSLLPATELLQALARDAAGSALPRRYVVCLRPEGGHASAEEVLGDEALVGADVNALCFVQNKFAGHQLRATLQGLSPERIASVYDGDMTADDRRAAERSFLESGQRGRTIIATSALEVGVDLPDLDLLVMDELPRSSAELLQRIGRVGRSAGKPGLVLLCLGYSPLDTRLLLEPGQVLSTQGLRPLPLPLHLDIVWLKRFKAIFDACTWRTKPPPGSNARPAVRAMRGSTMQAFCDTMRRHYGDVITLDELDALIDERLSDVVDLSDPFWFYKGFRSGASEGKRPLQLEGTSKVVARIDDLNVFRDAHPEAVYLGHYGDRFRVVGYRGDFEPRSRPGGDILLGKFIHALKTIEVRREPENIATRGVWRDDFELYEPKELPPGSRAPRGLQYGAWNFRRRFDGYREIDLSGRRKQRRVTLAEVSQRFRSAQAAGQDFPFLHAFSYRTLGFRWSTPALAKIDLRRLAPALEGVLRAYLCDGAECSRGDLFIGFDPKLSELRVLDASPGGNGSSAALTQQDRAADALLSASAALDALAVGPPEAFRRFLAEECHVEAEAEAAEVAGALARLAYAWTT